MLGDTPKHRAIVNIEDRSCPIGSCIVHCRHTCPADFLIREMRTGYSQELCCSNIVFINITRLNCHVRAVFTVEQEWKRLFIFDCQNCQGRQPFLIDRDVADVNTICSQLGTDKFSHCLITDTGYYAHP